MDFLARQIAPPKSWDVFEDLCLTLFQAVWQDPAAQKHGRQGQEQRGVDVFGKNYPQGGGWCGVQCKVKDSTLAHKVSHAEVLAEIAKVETFFPKLQSWILATTAKRDAKIQELVRAQSDERAAKGLFTVAVYAWEDIHKLLSAYPDVARQFYPECFAVESAKAPVFHLPEMRLSPHFSDPVGHLAQLRWQLTTQKSAAVLAATTVQGMGGVGKTQLALKYCHEFRAEYAGVWWFSAENLEVLATECMAFCGSQQITLVPNIPVQQAMADWLAALPATALPWLLVYDNADDAKTLKKFLPRAGAHHVLITSRLPTWVGMGTLHLDVWTGTQALAFLQARLPHESEGALLALTTALDGLPLALEQACAYLGNNHIAVADYIERVTQLGHDIVLLGREDSDDCAKSVLATLSLAFDRLSAPAQALLQLCGYFAPEPVPEYVFTENPANLPESLQAAGQDQFLWRETVAELERYALCQAPLLMQADFLGNNGVQQRCLVLHRLTQTAARAWLGAGTGAGTDVATDTSVAGQGFDAFRHVIMLLRGVFPLHVDYPEHWPRCRSLMPHVQRLAAFHAAANMEPLRYTYLLGQLATYLTRDPALWAEALRLARLALAIRQTALGQEHPDTLALMNNPAVTIEQLLDGDGVRLQEKMLDICRRVLGEDHPDTLTAMNNLALKLGRQDNLPGARLLLEKTLDICRRVHGEEHPATLTTMYNLAVALRHQGDLPGARILLERALDISHRVQGEEHPDTLRTMCHLALTLSQQGDLLGARMLLEKALDISHRVQGENHPLTIFSKGELAVILAAMGETAAAQALRDEIACSTVFQ